MPMNVFIDLHASINTWCGGCGGAGGGWGAAGEKTILHILLNESIKLVILNAT